MLAMVVYIIKSVMLMIPNKLAMNNGPPPVVKPKSQNRRSVFQTPHLDTIFSQPYEVKISLTLKGAEKSNSDRTLTCSLSISLNALGIATMLIGIKETKMMNQRRYCLRR